MCALAICIFTTFFLLFFLHYFLFHTKNFTHPVTRGARIQPDRNHPLKEGRAGAVAPPIPINVDIVDAASHIGGADRPCVRMGSATLKNEQRQHTPADEGSGMHCTISPLVQWSLPSCTRDVVQHVLCSHEYCKTSFYEGGPPPNGPLRGAACKNRFLGSFVF